MIDKGRRDILWFSEVKAHETDPCSRGLAQSGGLMIDKRPRGNSWFLTARLFEAISWL